MQRREFLGGTCSQPPELPDELTAKRLMRWVFWSQRGYMTGVMMAGVAWMSLQAVLPVAIGGAVGQGIRNRSWSMMTVWIGVVLALTAAQGAMWVIRHRLALGIHVRSNAWGERLVYARALASGGGLDEVITPGDLVSHLAIDIRRIAAVMDVVGRGTGAIVTFTAVVGAMFVVSWQLASAVLAGLLPMLAVLARRMRSLERRTRAQQRALGSASSVAADAIGGIRVVKGVGGEDEAIRRYQAETDSIVGSALWAADIRSQTLSIDLMMPIVIVIVTVVAWLGGRLAIDHRLSIGELITFSGWSIFLVTPLLTFGEMGRKWAAAHAAAIRVVNLLTLPHDVDGGGDHVGIADVATVELRDVTVLVAGVPVLSLDPPRNNLNALVSGS